ncbi:serine carboxypeptidase-like 42 isoform X1 [Glycine soja]|uniref:Carboxypeptidase n=2 Tax=Glycine soja TaxID=3848 RepID=A0A445H6Z6_GLYSO|nr:serine carboxypeptidase-like 42 isoform X1 [Glycine soja]RZB69222.1 Serine carboxypeptidase-like 42 isoform A [Glycine soja]
MDKGWLSSEGVVVMGRCWLVGVIIVVGCASFLGTVGVVEGYPAEDLVVKLPGQPKVGFKQFAGYVDVDAKHGRSLFYYFVEAEQDPHKKPLTLWLNGGPGCSSIGGGAFTELGPFYPKGDGRGLRRNSMSWNKASNLLFVESPAGVGWSYSNTTSDYNSGDASTANDMYLFMLKWYEKFPSYITRELFLTGESYAGHYIPQLTNVLLDHNARSTGSKFNIKGVAIGNPLLRLDRDAPAIYEYFWSHGMISDEIGLAIMNDCDFDDYVYASPHNVSQLCNNAIYEANLIVGDYINNYDVILDVCYTSIMEQELRLKRMATKISVSVDVCITLERRFYFNLPEVQKALHANRTNLPYSWSMCSHVLNYRDTDGNINILPILKRIVQNHIPVWVFSGDQDSVVPLLGSRTLIRELAHELQFKITVPYGAWFHKGQVGGWVTEYGNLLTFATVRGAAHMVPYAQPSRALHLFSSFVRGRRLPNTTRPSIDE